jgi:hypothetical protein
MSKNTGAVSANSTAKPHRKKRPDSFGGAVHYLPSAAGDKRRQAKIMLDDNEATMSGRITQDIPAGYSAEDIPQDEDGEPVLQGAKSRFTMLIAPVKYHLVKDAAEAIAIDYKVNIIGGNERSATMAHTVLPKSDKKIILRQVK